MTQKEFDGAVECLSARLHHCLFSFIDSLMQWMIEHNVEPALAEDMLTEAFRDIDGQLAQFLVQRGLASSENEEATIQ
jgi:hypothetical protein